MQPIQDRERRSRRPLQGAEALHERIRFLPQRFRRSHFFYAMSLKNIGSALSDYAQAELPYHYATTTSVPPSSNTAAPFPLPPDVNFQPLQRATSMPEMKIMKKPAMAGPTMISEEDEEGEIEFEAHASEKLVRKQRSSSNRGSNARRDDHIQNQNHISSTNDRVERAPQQQQHHHDCTWDYFFPSVDSIPGPTLAEPTVVMEEVAEKVEEEEREVAVPLSA